MTPPAPAGFDLVLRAAPLPICLLDGRGYVLAWNQACEDSFERRAASVVGSSLADALGSPSDHVAPLVSLALAGDVVRQVRVPGRRPDGTPMQLVVSLGSSGARDQGGLICVLTDVTAEARVEHTLRTSENRLRKILQSINDTITVLDEHGHSRDGSGSVTTILGYPLSFWDDQDVFALVHPDDLVRMATLFDEVKAAPGARARAEMRIRDVDGSWQTIEGTGVNLLDDPDVGGVLVTTRNVTDAKRTEQLVAGQANILRLVARGAAIDPTLLAVAELVERQIGTGSCGIVVAEPGRRRQVVTPHHQLAGDLIIALGATLDGAAASPGHTLVARSAADPALGAVGVRLAEAGWASCWSMAVIGATTGRPDGSITCVFDTDRAVTTWEHDVAAVAADLVAIALDRHRAERRLAALAMLDGLTGLANRRLLTSRLELAIPRAQRERTRLALVFLDLDRFKAVNDTYGHEAGDVVLREFGARLLDSVGARHTVARFGGDEFVVLVEDVGRDDQVDELLDAVRSSLDAPFGVGDGLHLTASLGVVTSQGRDGSAVTLLRDADAAMYRAKARRRHRARAFDAPSRSEVVWRLRVEGELRRALEHDELELLYRPSHDLASGRLVGVDALVRWAHPERGLLDPADLLETMDDAETVARVGAWLTDRALHELHADHPHLPVAIDLPTHLLVRPGFTEGLDEVLDHHHPEPGRLVVRVDGSPALATDDTARAALAHLVGRGVPLAVGDVGANGLLPTPGHLTRGLDGVAHAALGHRMLADLLSSPATAPFVRAVVDLVRAVGLELTVTGIGDAADVAALRALGCERGQGPLFSGPVPVDQLRHLGSAARR